MKNGLSKRVPFLPWNQEKYFEGLNEFANSHVEKIKEEKGVDLGDVEVKPYLDGTKNNYWSGLIEHAKRTDALPLSVGRKKTSLGMWGYMAAIFYPADSLANHIVNHVYTGIVDEVKGTTIYVSTGLGSRLNLSFNTEKIKKEITSTLDSWSSKHAWPDHE